MTAPAGAAYVASSKLISVIGSMARKLIEPGLKGLNYLREESPLCQGNSEKIAWLETCQRIRHKFREHISLCSGWVIGGESEDMSVIKCNVDAMTSGRRDPSNRSILLRVHKLWDFSPYVFNSSPDGSLETYWLETTTLRFLRETCKLKSETNHVYLPRQSTEFYRVTDMDSHRS